MTATKPPQEQLLQPQIPAEWLAELQQLPIGSPEHEEFIAALGELGIVSMVSNEANTEELGPPPNGFVSWQLTPGGASLATKQLEQAFPAFSGSSEHLVADALELTTDLGNKVRVCDLRPYMSASIRKTGPQTHQDQDKLDRAFFSDLKAFADMGHGRNTVTLAAVTTYYTRAGNTSMRAYWTPVKDELDTSKVRTVARIGDSGNNKGYETKLYRRLFGEVIR